MYKLLKLDVERIEKGKLTAEYVINFFVRGNFYKVIMVYDGDVFYGSIDWNVVANAEFLLCRTEEKWNEFLKGINRREVVSEKDIDTDFLKEIDRMVRYIPVVGNKQDNVRLFYDIMPRFQQRDIHRQYVEPRDLLRNYGGHAYLINFPDMTNRVPTSYPMLSIFSWIEETRVKQSTFLSKVTEKSYDEARAYMLNHMTEREREPVHFGEFNKTIYLVGPCIVMGTTSLKDEDFPTMLYQKVQKYGYGVERISMGRETAGKGARRILEKTICKNDIVLFFSYGLDNGADIDLFDLFTQSTPEQPFYYDITTRHTTPRGNQHLIDIVLKEIILPLQGEIDETKNETVLYRGRKQYSEEEENQIKSFLREMRTLDDPVVKEGESIGAVVVNCNPFTKGHQYLIETAAEQVDYLYVFVVEEDGSYFAFEDRFAMVAAGTKHLQNVCVKPSGKYILSKMTFPNYFTKEISEEQVDATRDIDLFGDFVAKEFGITRRFVGEEPFDAVTREYNETMKRQLPWNGIEVTEIPRKEIDGQAISATGIRRLLSDREWDKLESLLPETSLDYLKKNIERIEDMWVEKRCCELYCGDSLDNSWMKESIKVILEHLEKGNAPLLIRGTGKNAKMLASSLPWKALEHCIFCDREVVSGATFFGRSLLDFEEATKQYPKAAIFIASRRYGEEIRKELLEQGIHLQRKIMV